MFLSLFFAIPLVVFSVSLYFSFLVFRLGLLSILVSLAITAIFSYSFLRRFSARPINKWLLIPAGILFLANAIVLLPLVTDVHLSGFTFITYPSATDFFKHLYAVTSISHFGLPPLHPYFPAAQFSYYYGYYLIPSAFSYLFPLVQHWALYLYVLLTSAVSLLFLVDIYTHFLRRSWQSFLAFLPAIFGLGWDIIPTLIDNRSPGGRLIELWSITHGLQLRIDNPFTAFAWTPQHFFAAIVALITVYLLVFTKIRNAFLFLCLYIYLFISSVFIFIPLCFFSLLYFIYEPEDRSFLFRVGIVSILLSLPFMFFIGGRGNLFEHFVPGVFPFFKNFLANRIVTWFIEYGPLLFFMPIWLFLFISKANFRRFLFIYVMVLVPIVATWFFRSPNYNDFALRSILPIQLVVPLLAAWLIGNYKSLPIKIALLALIILSFVGSLPGFAYEYASRWRERGILDVETSQMLMAVQKLPRDVSLAAIGKDVWIFQIPPWGFHPILTSNLYDSANYLGPLPGDLHTQYEILDQEIFSTQTIDRDLNSVLAQRNSKLSGFNIFFSAFQYNYLLAKNSDPWTPIFKSLASGSKPLTPHFTLIPRPQLLNHSLQISYTGTPISISSLPAGRQDFKSQIPVGSWFLVSCNSSGVPYQILKIDNYTVFQGSVSQNGCIGNFYSQASTSSAQLSSDTTITNLTAYPLVVK